MKTIAEDSKGVRKKYEKSRACFITLRNDGNPLTSFMCTFVHLLCANANSLDGNKPRGTPS